MGNLHMTGSLHHRESGDKKNSRAKTHFKKRIGIVKYEKKHSIQSELKL